ncbi:hypothetical protein B0H14DRAFT_3721458 [Mycena olivaceomarginata]|nr:hypothetical protein B0H14DRAFT_3721458 [Mycena olivaceomarginata]
MVSADSPGWISGPIALLHRRPRLAATPCCTRAASATRWRRGTEELQRMLERRENNVRLPLDVGHPENGAEAQDGRGKRWWADGTTARTMRYLVWARRGVGGCGVASADSAETRDAKGRNGGRESSYTTRRPRCRRELRTFARELPRARAEDARLPLCRVMQMRRGRQCMETRGSCRRTAGRGWCRLCRLILGRNDDTADECIGGASCQGRTELRIILENRTSILNGHALGPRASPPAAVLVQFGFKRASLPSLTHTHHPPQRLHPKHPSSAHLSYKSYQEEKDCNEKHPWAACRPRQAANCAKSSTATRWSPQPSAQRGPLFYDADPDDARWTWSKKAATS